MAVLLDDASSEYLMGLGTPTVTAMPFTISAWFNTDYTGSTNQAIFAIADKDNRDRCVLDLDDGMAGIRCDELGDYNRGQTVNTYSVNEWSHACGLWTSTTSRTIYLNGDTANKGTDTGSVNPTGFDSVTAGVNRYSGSSYAWYLSGSVAEVAVWNVALAEDEVVALSRGLSPLLVRPGSLKSYWPFYSVTSLVDIVGGYHLTAYNTPASSDHAIPIVNPLAMATIPAAAGAPAGPPKFLPEDIGLKSVNTLSGAA